jgi:hypothetical protein
MNNGTMRGFTWQSLPSGATYPEMKVRYIPYTVANLTMGSGNIDTLNMIDTGTGAVTIELDGSGVREGQCIHVARWGANGVTFTNADGILRCAGTATTRAQYSVMTAMFVSSYYNEWIVFGDITV